ncbi:MAG: tRNA pseudouridine(38-40) synthase TruA [Chloroflexi bacterium]|nr:tRNA pseudouridine(38-40) synthase TruA [Chloroflexota bacterium]
MPRLLAIVEYDGTDFEGFQIQKRGRTVQGELERALQQITGEQIRVMGGGRTDSGVHALGQGAHFDTNWKRPVATLQRALNAVLPTDIAVRSLVEVGKDFSARYSARSRAYRYTILNQPVRSPLLRRYALFVPEPLDADAMDAAARCLIGTHDFGAFGTPPHGDNSVRDMIRARVRKEGASILIDLEANAFLYRMVRRIVGTLLWIGRGEMTIAEFRQVLSKERRAGQSVAPQGLCLVAVKYDLATESH